MSDQIIPLTSDPNQTLKTTVSVNGQNKSLQLDIRYNDIAGYWIMKVTDLSTGTVLLDSMPLLCGLYPASNLLGQYAYLGIGSAYVIKASDIAADSPDDTNLGTDFFLVWSD